jgi:hypothetical protein
MAEPTAAGVNHHAHLPLELEPHLGCGVLVVDPIDDLYFRVVVPSAERAELR